MYGKDDGNTFADHQERIQDVAKPLRFIDIAGAMKRDQRIAGRESVARQIHRLRKQLDQAIDHHVSDQMNFLCGNAFTKQVCVAVFRWSEQNIGQLIGDDTIDFFRHGTVK